MNVGATFLAISSLVLCTSSAQTPAPDAAKLPEAAQLEALAKKIEEQRFQADLAFLVDITGHLNILNINFKAITNFLLTWQIM